MADRHGPLRTVVGRFVERVNGGRISDGAVVVTAADFGVDKLSLGVVEGTPTVPADKVTVIVPGNSWRRAFKLEDERLVPVEETVLLVPGSVLGDEPFTPRRDGSTGNGRVLDSRELLPPKSWTAAGGDGGPPSGAWLALAGDPCTGGVEKVERAKKFVGSPGWTHTGTESWEQAFGFTSEDLPGRRTEDGETFDPEETLVALTGRALVETWPGDGPPDTLAEGLERGDDVPNPAPMGGVTFGMGVLSTPTASVAGESVNPLAQAETTDLLQRDASRRMLARAGVTDVEQVTWTAGPEPISPADLPSTTSLLGTETEVEGFVGVVEGDSGLWGVGVHVARVDAEDHVVAAGVHRRAIGKREVDDATMQALQEGIDVVEGRRLFVATAEQLALE